MSFPKPVEWFEAIYKFLGGNFANKTLPSALPIVSGGTGANSAMAAMNKLIPNSAIETDVINYLAGFTGAGNEAKKLSPELLKAWLGIVADTGYTNAQINVMVEELSKKITEIGAASSKGIFATVGLIDNSINSAIAIGFSVGDGNWFLTYNASLFSGVTTALDLVFGDGKLVIASSYSGKAAVIVIADKYLSDVRKIQIPGVSSASVLNLAYGNGIWAALCNTTQGVGIFTSSDLDNWTLAATVSNIIGLSSAKIDYAEGLFFIYGQGPTGGIGGVPGLATSPDCRIWNKITVPFNGLLQCFAYGGGRAVVAGFDFNTKQRVSIISSDSQAWTKSIITPSSGGALATVSGLAYGDGAFCATIQGGSSESNRVSGAFTLVDGASSWVDTSAPSAPNQLITYGRGLFMCPNASSLNGGGWATNRFLGVNFTSILPNIAYGHFK